MTIDKDLRRDLNITNEDLDEEVLNEYITTQLNSLSLLAHQSTTIGLIFDVLGGLRVKLHYLEEEVARLKGEKL